MITSGFVGRILFEKRPWKRVWTGVEVESTFQVERGV